MDISPLIPEKDALVGLMQVYQSLQSRWASTSITLGIALFVIPFFVLQASLDPRLRQKLDDVRFFFVSLRLLCFVVTLILAINAVYLSAKAVYLEAMLQESLMQLKVTNKEISLAEYNTQIKEAVRRRYAIFRLFKKPVQYKERELESLYQMQFWSLCIIVPFLITLILFSFIWWGRSHFWRKLLLSEGMFVFFVWMLFRFFPIM